KRRTIPPHPQPEVRSTSVHARRIQDTFAGPARTTIRKEELQPPPEYETNVLAGLRLWKDDVGSPPPVTPPAPVVTPPPPDFHRIISLLREHPSVLRALGL